MRGAGRGASFLAPWSCECGAVAPTTMLPHSVPSGIPNGRQSRSAGYLDSQHAPCGRRLRGGCWEPGRQPGSVGGEWVGPLTLLLARRGFSSALEKEKGFCRLPGSQASQERRPFGRAAGRVRLVCPGFLPPSADARSVLTLPFQSCLLPDLPPAQQRETHLAQKQTGSRGNLGQAQIIKGRNQCLLLRRGIHVLYLQCGSFQTHSKSVCLVLVPC